MDREFCFFPIRILEAEKKNLEISLKDEVTRRKDAEYALERTKEELQRKTEEFALLEEQYTEALGTIETLFSEGSSSFFTPKNTLLAKNYL